MISLFIGKNMLRMRLIIFGAAFCCAVLFSPGAAAAVDNGYVYTQAEIAGLTQFGLISEPLLHSGLENAVKADGWAVGVAAKLGYSSQSIDLDNDVDVDGMSGIFSMSYNKIGSPVAFGIFGEMFRGDYEISRTFEHKGDLRSYGGGFSIQYRQRLAEALNAGTSTIWVPGFHAEAAARIGSTKMDLAANDGAPLIFQVSGEYYGLSLGGGYVFETSEDLAIDLYARGVWLSIPERRAVGSLGERLRLGIADSMRIIAGFRAGSGYKRDERLRKYFGMALDWEVLGEVDACISGRPVKTADVSGVSCLFELGVNWKASGNVFIDLRGVGSLGKRRGIGGMLEIKYEF